MADKHFTCPRCEADNVLHGGGGASTVVEIACWSCDEVFEVNRYKMTVIDT